MQYFGYVYLINEKYIGRCSMGKIAIVTDSNSGITQDEGRELGVYVLPMPFYINEVMYLEGITLSQEEFYERLKNDETISTSQPSPAEVCGGTIF